MNILDIISVIQQLPARDKRMRILISLANSFYERGFLSEKQTALLKSIADTAKKQSV